MRDIDELIGHFEAEGIHYPVSFKLANEVATAISNKLPINATHLSNVDAVLMYQNLLLARRIEQIEWRLDQEVAPCVR